MKTAVYRVSTSAYRRGDQYEYTRSIRKILRLSRDTFDLLDAEIDAIGEYDALRGIRNLSSVKDGLYTLTPYGCSRDWETGIEECDGLELVQYREASESDQATKL